MFTLEDAVQIVKPHNDKIVADARIEKLERALSAAEGFLLNAKIDLETGAPKSTAIRTIEGGLKMIREAR